MDEHYSTEWFSTWDLMHLAAIMDNSLRNLKKPWAREMLWLNSPTTALGKIVGWANFFKVYFVFLISR